MERRDRIKRVFKDLSQSSKKISASGSASTTSGPALNKPRLKEPTDGTSRTFLTSRQPQDAPVRDLWGLALEKLPDEEKAAISQIVSDTRLDILRHLHAAAEKKRNDCEAQRWKFKLKGRQIILRDVAEKIIFWVDKFKQIGDIAVNFDQVHASLPWAGLRFLLEITVSESQQMGALLTGVEKITSLIGRCQIYEALYLKRELGHEKWKEALLNLTSALVALYAIMLRFLGSAIRAYNQGIISRTLDAVLNPSKVIGFLDKCQTLENDVVHEVDNCEHILQASSGEHIRELKDILDDWQPPVLLRIDSRVADLWQRLDSSKRLKILQWISSIPYEENHFFARQERTNGTGEWLLRHEKYREWRSSSASMILWLHGDPGAGKTKLVSKVVDDLLDTFKQFPNDEAFAYFYCDRNQPDRRDPDLILSSFVRQLSTFQNDDAIPRPTLQMYEQKKHTGFASGKLKLEESRTVLADLLEIYPQITLVVDALDECNINTRSAFIKALDKLVDESPKPIKIFISSRRDRDIKHRFENGPNLEIRAVDNRDDIAMFVNHEITSSETFWQDDISSELKELICNTLVDRSEGMFQWVSLQITALRELCRERDIRNRLGKLPKTLRTAYDELYLKIQSQEESTPEIANRAFQWVMCSCWPLSPAELVAAVCQNPDTDEIDEVDISVNTVLGACQNLLVVDQALNVCRFSHLSVQEYFETYHWSSGEGDCLVGKVCLLSLIYNNSTTLEQDALPTKNLERYELTHDVLKCRRLKRLPEEDHLCPQGGIQVRVAGSVQASIVLVPEFQYDVLRYACRNWVTHVQRIEGKEIVEKRLTALLKRFLGSMDQSSLPYQNWPQMMKRGFLYSTFIRAQGYPPELTLVDGCEILSPYSRASFAIVAFGFYRTILDWWTVGFADVNGKNSKGCSLLLLGVMGGSVSIARDLLKKGANVNAAGGYLGNALQAASAFGDETMVQLLLDNGADINASGGRFGNALQAASWHGSKSIIKLLLDNGADINAAGGEYDNALSAASAFGHESVVKLLLDEGADVNPARGEHETALTRASNHGCESVVKLLLDKGADVNASSRNHFGSALSAASYWGHESVIRLLLDKGADINLVCGYNNGALSAASQNGHESVVRLLLDNGADVNVAGGTYGSVLYVASNYGNEAVVQLLQAAMNRQ